MSSTAMLFATTPITSLSEMKLRKRHSFTSCPQFDGIKLPSGSDDFFLQRPVCHNPCRAVIVGVIDRRRDVLILSRRALMTDDAQCRQHLEAFNPHRPRYQYPAVPASTLGLVVSHTKRIARPAPIVLLGDRRLVCAPPICATTLRRPLPAPAHSGRR